MILIAGFLLVLASVPLAGGRFSRLRSLHLRWAPAVLAALAVQVLVINVVPDALPLGVAALVHLATYGMAVAFLVVNRHVTGLWLIGLGGMMNLAAIASNGGVMPASRQALESAGMATSQSGFTNSTAVDDARLAFLGDVFAVPEGLPLANVFSLGDVLLLVGAAVLLHRICRSRLGAMADSEAAGVLSRAQFRRVWESQALSATAGLAFLGGAACVLLDRERGGAGVIALVLVQAGASAVGRDISHPFLAEWGARRVVLLSIALRGLALVSLIVSPDAVLLHVCIVGACMGLGGALHRPSSEVATARVLGPSRAAAGAVALGLTRQLAIAVGPVVGALLARHAGGRATFVVIGAAVAVAGVRFVAADAGTPGAPAGRSVDGDVLVTSGA